LSLAGATTGRFPLLTENASRGGAAAPPAYSSLVADLSHELRTPLASILAYCDLLHSADEPLPWDEVKETVGTIVRQAERLLEQVNGVLDLAKLEAGRVVLALGAVDLHLAASEAVQTVRPLASAKGLTLTLAIPDDLPQAWGDEGRTIQALINLIGNSVKFTQTGGITVRARAENQVIVIDVEDTGPGIPADQLRALFDEYRQTGSISSRSKGTGLGLAISRRLIALQSGQLSVQSTVGVGTTFSFTLPRQALVPDAVTSLARRERLDELLRLEAQRIARYGGSVSLVLIALDDYEGNALTLGEAGVEELFRELAMLVARHSRRTDHLGVWDRGTVGVILTGTTGAGAELFAAKIRNLVGMASFAAHDCAAPSITTGIASFDEASVQLDRELERQAEASLRTATAQGPGATHRYARSEA